MLPEEGLGFHLPSLIAYGINFLLLVGILYVVGYKRILKMLDERQSRIRESLETADRVRQEAAQQQQELQRQLEAARQEGQQMMAQARESADRFRQEEQERAGEAVAQMLTRARAEIQQERDAAVEEVRRHFADLAIRAAERVVERSIDRDAHRQVIERVLEESGDLKR
ncbi:MAG: ATP synthase F0 subunit B [Dehalococcoidia bacterium]|nr:ATP synthase F0 subunit B [Dehalococcoidia bacterium]